jgi:hypothetical protein
MNRPRSTHCHWTIRMPPRREMKALSFTRRAHFSEAPSRKSRPRQFQIFLDASVRCMLGYNQRTTEGGLRHEHRFPAIRNHRRARAPPSTKPSHPQYLQRITKQTHRIPAPNQKTKILPRNPRRSDKQTHRNPREPMHQNASGCIIYAKREFPPAHLNTIALPHPSSLRRSVASSPPSL